LRAWVSVCACARGLGLRAWVSVCAPGSRFARLGLGWVGRAGRPNTARGRGTARVSMPNGAHTTPMDGSTATWALHTPTGEVGQRGSRPSPPHAPGTGSRFCARRTRVLTLIARVKVLTRIHGTAGVKANVPLKGEHNGEKGYVLNAYGQSLHLPINQCPLTT